MIKRNPATFVVSVIVHDIYRTHMIGKGDSMIIQGLGKTRMFGSTVQVAEDYMNITESIRQGLTYRYDKQTADEFIVSAIKMVLLNDTDRHDEAERELGEIMMKLAEA